LRFRLRQEVAAEAEPSSMLRLIATAIKPKCLLLRFIRLPSSYKRLRWFNTKPK
jgi:hypothetical protein